MSRLLVAGVLVSGLTVAVSAQDHEHCPLAASSQPHHAAVDQRHDQASGVSHDGVTHHFVLAKDGGSIRLEVNNAGDTATRDRIREHLQVVARSFAAGDFSLPMLIHDQAPSGVDVMKAHKNAIDYAYAPSARGGVVAISTHDSQALDAVHAFLRFQIRDHETNDATE